MRKAFVLLSGGLDSTTCLYKAIADHFDNKLGSILDTTSNAVEAISINYNQRHVKELKAARDICNDLGIRHTVFFVGDILSSGDTMLTNRNVKIPDVDYSDLPHGVSPTYVPFRNGTMLSLITAQAQKWVNAQLQAYEVGGVPMVHRGKVEATIYFGAHAEDAHNWAYPDCTPEFIGAMANAIYVGTYNKVRLSTPLMNMTKADIVEFGYKLGVPFEKTWSCYKGEELHCGICPTCRSRRNAFAIARCIDPTKYANAIPEAAE
jgi:7-cyano-7-deazaguanine synthase